MQTFFAIFSYFILAKSLYKQQQNNIAEYKVSTLQYGVLY